MFLIIEKLIRYIVSDISQEIYPLLSLSNDSQAIIYAAGSTCSLSGKLTSITGTSTVYGTSFTIYSFTSSTSTTIGS